MLESLVAESTVASSIVAESISSGFYVAGSIVFLAFLRT